MYRELLGMRQDEVRAEIAGLEREALNLLAADSVPLDYCDLATACDSLR